MKERTILLTIFGAFAGLTVIGTSLSMLPRGEVVVRSELPGATVRAIRLVEGERTIGRASWELGPGDRASMGFGAFEKTHTAHVEFEVVSHGRSVQLRSRDEFEIHRGEDLAVVLDADFPVINRAVGPADAG